MKSTTFRNIAIFIFAVISMAGCKDDGNGNGGTTPSVLTALTITPSNLAISLGSTQQFTITGTYSDGASADLTSSVTWTSSEAAIATVDSTGLATSVAAGSATIKAASGNISASAVLTVKDLVRDSPFGFNPAGVFTPDYSNKGYGDAQHIGVKWARDGVFALWFQVQPDLTQQNYDFTKYDTHWSRVPDGINILANIAPQGRIDEGYCLPGSYMPVDSDKYTAFVKATVERYDGDGVDDMPGLTNPIKYWQVGNEPSDFGAKGFADLQRITYIAIKESCPDCTVLIGGVPGMPPVSDYIANFDKSYKPILEALAGNYVDVMDFHWYGEATGDYRGARETYDRIRAVLDVNGFYAIPFWITEMGAYSGDPTYDPVLTFDYPLQTERQQALDYFKRFVYPLSFGVKKIFPAYGFMEGFKQNGGYFDFTGLIYDGWDPAGTTPTDQGLGVKKLGYYTYKKMTEVLEGSDWNAIQVIQESDNVYVYKLLKSGSPIYVAWWDYFNEPSFVPGNTKLVAITGLQGLSAIVTEVVPKFATGAEVTDYSAAFTTSTLAISNGSVTLSLSENPVFVEVLQ